MGRSLRAPWVVGWGCHDVTALVAAWLSLRIFCDCIFYTTSHCQFESESCLATTRFFINGSGWMDFLNVEKLGKTFSDGTKAVSEINLEIEQGEFVVLLGPSGCGKTTTLRMLAGLESPTSGHVWLEGERIDHLPASRRDVGFVFQFYALYPHMTVGENVGFPLECDGVNRSEYVSRVEETLDRMKLSPLAQKFPDQLSGGDQQRVALARAMVRRPKLWLMDEPIGNLDSDMRLGMREVIRAQQLESGVTTIYVTHDQEEAMTLADRVVVMDCGCICQQGSPRQVYDKPENLFVAHFMGTPGMNLLKGEIVTEPSVVFNGSNLTEGLPVSAYSGVPGDVVLGIRPEFISVDSDGLLSATVVTDELLGRYRNVHLETDMGKVVMRVECEQRNRRYPPGDRLTLMLDEKQIRFFDPKTGKQIERGRA